MHELTGPSTAQRLSLAVTLGLWVALAWWLLLGSGFEAARRWFSWIGAPGNAIRRIPLAAAFSVYYVRASSKQGLRT